MNDNNMNQTPNTGNYYQQSGYPQSEQSFSQPDIPYPLSGYAEEKKSKSKTMQIAVISIVAVLIVALATTLIVVLQRKNQQQPGGMQPPPPPQMETIISVSENGSMINGQTADIDFFEKDGKAYLKLEDITSTAGYDFVREGNQVKLLSQLELAIIDVGSTNVTLQDQTSKETSSVEILKAPFEKNDDIYIYSRDLSVFLKNTNVSYNSMTGSIEIRISAGMGAPNGQPPMDGQMPPGGQAQPGAQSQQNTPEIQNDTENKTDKENDKGGTSKSAEQKREERSPGGQPPQN